MQITDPFNHLRRRYNAGGSTFDVQGEDISRIRKRESSGGFGTLRELLGILQLVVQRRARELRSLTYPQRGRGGERHVAASEFDWSRRVGAHVVPRAGRARARPLTEPRK